jgi:hypothetical protein
MSDSTKKSLGAEYETLNRHVFTLNLRWHTYERIFNTSEQRIDLLNDHVLGFAWVVHDLLVEALILGICRLTDPPETAGRENLTLARIIANLSPPPGAALNRWLTDRLAKIEGAVSSLRMHRNKRLGHIDL